MWDYIIVGAGSAGCVLANRLSADPNCRVLLLEAGGPADSEAVQQPANYANLQNTHLDWAYRTVPQPHLHNRRINWPRGKALGGSSAINYMVYVRGCPLDFDRWQAAGNEGWGYEELLPYFIRAEGNQDFGEPLHGQTGPLSVMKVTEPHPLTARFLTAAEALGLPATEDVNGGHFAGMGRYQATIGGGERCSSARAYLLPVLERPNLTVQTRALALKINFDGRRAVGITYLQAGAVHEARVDGDLLLAGGAINSPQLLLLSGVGPAGDLSQLHIPVVADLPGVGENLQDHLRLTAGCEIKEPHSLNALEEKSRRELDSLYRTERQGLLASNILEAGGFLKLLPDSAAPDTQLFFYPTLPAVLAAGQPPRHGFGLSCYTGRPRSRGRLRLATADPLDQPLLDPNYLAAAEDEAAALAGMRCLLALADTEPLASLRQGPLLPEVEIDDSAGLLRHIRATGDTGFHPVGTCRMGQDPQAVVGPDLRVHGMDNLRVIDASIMPNIVSGNTNAATIAIGEKGADLVLGRTGAAHPS